MSGDRQDKPDYEAMWLWASREHVSAHTASLIKDWVKRNYEAA